MPRNEIDLWRTKDGREIPVSEMEDIHVLRSIRLLKHRLVQLGLTVPEGDPASNFRKWSMEESSAQLEMLEEEAKRRKLDGWSKFGIEFTKKALGD